MAYSRREISSDEYRDNNSDTHPSVNPALKKHRGKRRIGAAGKGNPAVRITIQTSKRTHRKRVAGK